MPLSKQLPLDQRASQIHDKMGKAFQDLCDAASALYGLEDHYDLAEFSIEMCNEWWQGMNRDLHKIGYHVDEAENWMFNGYSLQEKSEDDLAETMGYEGQKENYEDHKDKEEM